MLAVVTGAAGFIGSHLSEQLVARGDQVRGIDCFTDYYNPSIKRDNLERLFRAENFELHEVDLSSDVLTPLIEGADVVFHQAGQPGVRASWASGFADYCMHNILATQRLLETARIVGTKRVVYASSSSIYGNALAYPVRETDLPRPQSPYGVSKLAAEHLCSLYAGNYGLSTVSLRYFTVYGPRQRPDMAFRRLVHCAFTGEPFPLYGSGHQVRDFTYVDDVIRANLLAADPKVPLGTIINIAGGTHVEMLEVIDLVGELTGRVVRLDQQPQQAGDVDRTEASTDSAFKAIGWQPNTQLVDGLRAMVNWARGKD